jgi:hypothetical protein
VRKPLNIARSLSRLSSYPSCSSRGSSDARAKTGPSNSQLSPARRASRSDNVCARLPKQVRLAMRGSVAQLASRRDATYSVSRALLPEFAGPRATGQRSTFRALDRCPGAERPLLLWQERVVSPTDLLLRRERQPGRWVWLF